MNDSKNSLAIVWQRKVPVGWSIALIILAIGAINIKLFYSLKLNNPGAYADPWGGLVFFSFLFAAFLFIFLPLVGFLVTRVYVSQKQALQISKKLRVATIVGLILLALTLFAPGSVLVAILIIVGGFMKIFTFVTSFFI